MYLCIYWYFLKLHHCLKQFVGHGPRMLFALRFKIKRKMEQVDVEIKESFWFDLCLCSSVDFFAFNRWHQMASNPVGSSERITYLTMKSFNSAIKSKFHYLPYPFHRSHRFLLKVNKSCDKSTSFFCRTPAEICWVKQNFRNPTILDCSTTNLKIKFNREYVRW